MRVCGRRPYKLRKDAWVPLCSSSPDTRWTSVLEILGMPPPRGRSVVADGTGCPGQVWAVPLELWSS